MSSFTSSYIPYEADYFNSVGISLPDLGSDTVIIEEQETTDVFICAHFKEFKMSKPMVELKSNGYKLNMNETLELEGQDMKFILQMMELNKVLNHFHDRNCYIMCDANTQVVQGSQNSLVFYEKEGKMSADGFVINGLPFVFDQPLFVENKTEDQMLLNNTTNKMRGTHTPQINKSFIESKTNIDYVIYKPKEEKEQVMNSFIYILDSNKKIKNKLPHELTTSSIAISDHSPVVTYVNGMDLCLGTFNIKGGNTEDTTWAEFLVEDYKEFFLNEHVQERINLLMVSAFQPNPDLLTLSTTEILKKLNTKNFVSGERFGICEVHMNPDYVPSLINSGKNIYASISNNNEKVYSIYFDYQENVKERYTVNYTVNRTLEEGDVLHSQVMNWIFVLLKDLSQYNDKQTEEWNIENQEKRRVYFQERVIYLLNFYCMVQKDRKEIVNDLCLYDIYMEWYLKNQEKVSIIDMIVQLKETNPLLKMVALQEFPVEKELQEKLIKSLECNDKMFGSVYLYSSPFIINKKQSSTQGAFFVYDDVYFSYLKI
jgi:hypothetical protein